MMWYPLIQTAGTSAPGPSGLSVAAEVALVILGGLAAISVVAILVLLIQFRRIYGQVQTQARGLSAKADPLLERSKAVAANLEFISATVRSDVEQLNESVKALSRRLGQASEQMEERVNEFNALLDVLQGEAEDVFLDTAATVRGVRTGARELTGRGGSGTPRTTPARRPAGEGSDGPAERGPTRRDAAETGTPQASRERSA